MSSEISQLCLEALSPLAEQCAKNQEKDTPLFIATRHFLKVHRFPTTVFFFSPQMSLKNKGLEKQ